LEEVTKSFHLHLILFIFLSFSSSSLHSLHSPLPPHSCRLPVHYSISSRLVSSLYQSRRPLLLPTISVFKLDGSRRDRLGHLSTIPHFYCLMSQIPPCDTQCCQTTVLRTLPIVSCNVSTFKNEKNNLKRSLSSSFIDDGQSPNFVTNAPQED
jgi:hypothetical protein